jgi:hypothetical protein
MHSPCMMEKGHPIRNQSKNERSHCYIQSQRRRDIPNPSRIVRVPKIIQITKGIRIRESSAHVAINRIMKNPHARRSKIDLMTQVLQNNNLGDFIPEGAKKKKEEDHAPKKGNHHALVAINSSSDSWIIYSGASHHMEAKEEVFTSLSSCSRPPILMGDDTLNSSCRRGKSGNP